MSQDIQMLANKLKDVNELLLNREALVERLLEQITELEEGCCRFNCRTARENWVMGFIEAASNTSYRVSDAGKVYDEYRKGLQETPSKGD